MHFCKRKGFGFISKAFLSFYDELYWYCTPRVGYERAPLMGCESGFRQDETTHKSNSSGSRYHTISGRLEDGSREVKCSVIIPQNGLCAGKKNLKRQKNGELPKQI